MSRQQQRHARRQAKKHLSKVANNPALLKGRDLDGYQIIATLSEKYQPHLAGVMSALLTALPNAQLAARLMGLGRGTMDIVAESDLPDADLVKSAEVLNAYCQENGISVTCPFVMHQFSPRFRGGKLVALVRNGTEYPYGEKAE